MITAILLSTALPTFFFVRYSVENKRIAEIIKHKGSNNPLNEDLINGIKINTIIQVGIVARTRVIVFFEMDDE